MKKNRYLALDYGGVIAYHYCEPFQTKIAELLNVSVETCKGLVSEKSAQGKAYRIGELDKSQFWQIVLSLSGQEGKDIDIDYLQELWSKTYQPNLELISFLFDIKEKLGVKLVLATNSDYLRSLYIKTNFEFYGKFDLIVSSWEYKIMKPSHEYFTKLIELTVNKGSPSDILFVDDRESTTLIAQKHGIDTYTYSNLENFINFIEEYYKI